VVLGRKRREDDGIQRGTGGFLKSEKPKKKEKSSEGKKGGLRRVRSQVGGEEKGEKGRSKSREKMGCLGSRRPNPDFKDPGRCLSCGKKLKDSKWIRTKGSPLKQRESGTQN